MTALLDPDPKRWSDRRQLTDAVLSRAATDTTIQGRVNTVAADEAVSVPTDLDWQRFNAMVQRMARRIILGDTAAQDAEISARLASHRSFTNPFTKRVIRCRCAAHIFASAPSRRVNHRRGTRTGRWPPPATA
jgi:hypothetical protein